MDWGVVTTVPANEAKAVADLDKVGLATYFPRYESVEAVRGRIIKRQRPLFPGYIFFGLIDDAVYLWRNVFLSERVTGVLKWDDDRPAQLPQEVIDELKERSGLDGVIRFDSRRKRKFNVGATVRAMNGALTGHTGVVEHLQSKDRLQVLFDMFGRKTTVMMREADITAG